VGAAAVLVLLAGVVATSAALDAPSQSSFTTTVVDAPRETVWDIVMDFESYPSWNPYMRSVSGRPGVGETLEIHLDTPDGEDDVSAEVYVYRPPRKLRWQSRMLLPGVRDLEYEIIVAPLGPDRAQVQQRARYEGLLAPFVDGAAAQRGLEAMSDALKHRAETTR
jgi:hypothetical protein